MFELAMTSRMISIDSASSNLRCFGNGVFALDWVSAFVVLMY